MSDNIKIRTEDVVEILDSKIKTTSSHPQLNVTMGEFYDSVLNNIAMRSPTLSEKQGLDAGQNPSTSNWFVTKSELNTQLTGKVPWKSIGPAGSEADFTGNDETPFLTAFSSGTNWFYVLPATYTFANTVVIPPSVKIQGTNAYTTVVQGTPTLFSMSDNTFLSGMAVTNTATTNGVAISVNGSNVEMQWLVLTSANGSKTIYSPTSDGLRVLDCGFIGGTAYISGHDFTASTCTFNCSNTSALSLVNHINATIASCIFRAGLFTSTGCRDIRVIGNHLNDGVSNAPWGVSFTFTPPDVDVFGNLVNHAAHGLKNGDRIYLSSNGLLPDPLTIGMYSVINVTNDTFGIATPEGTPVTLTSQGTGVHSLDLREILFRANTPNSVNNESDDFFAVLEYLGSSSITDTAPLYSNNYGGPAGQDLTTRTSALDLLIQWRYEERNFLLMGSRANVDLVNAQYSSNNVAVTGKGIFVKSDGLSVYTVSGGTVHQYSMTAGNITTAASVGTLDVSAQGTSTNDIFFKLDGTKMYLVESSTDKVYQYSLSTPWLLSSASLNVATIDVSPVGTSSNGLFISPDGTKLYVCGISQEVAQYTLTTAWDISSAVLFRTEDFSLQSVSSAAIYFTADGYQMFIVDSVSARIFIYNLSMAWDISTAIYTTFLSVSGHTSSPNGLFFSKDYSSMYVDSAAGSYQYTVPVTTPTQDLSTSPWTMTWNPVTHSLSSSNSIQLISPHREAKWILPTLYNMVIPDGWALYYVIDRSLTTTNITLSPYTTPLGSIPNNSANHNVYVMAFCVGSTLWWRGNGGARLSGSAQTGTYFIDGSSKSLLDYIGAVDVNDSDPNYSNNFAGVQSESLTIRAGKLDLLVKRLFEYSNLNWYMTSGSRFEYDGTSFSLIGSMIITFAHTANYVTINSFSINLALGNLLYATWSQYGLESSNQTASIAQVTIGSMPFSNNHPANVAYFVLAARPVAASIFMFDSTEMPNTGGRWPAPVGAEVRPIDTPPSFVFLPAAVDTVNDWITISSHGLSLNHPVKLSSSGTLPSPLVAGTTYYVVNPTTNTFQLSLFQSGTPINILTVGTGNITLRSTFTENVVWNGTGLTWVNLAVATSTGLPLTRNSLPDQFTPVVLAAQQGVVITHTWNTGANQTASYQVVSLPLATPLAQNQLLWAQRWGSTLYFE